VTHIAKETVAAIEAEIPALAKLHHHEVGCLPDEDFDLNVEDYKKLEACGFLRVFTCRNNKELVGYCVVNACPGHSHYRKLKWAVQDSLYVLPSYRGIMPVRFIIYMDLTLKAEGFHIVHRADTPKRPYGRLLEHIGYVPSDCGYIRDLREVA